MNMLPAGEQVKAAAVSPRRALVAFALLVLLGAYLFSEAGNLAEYKLYFTTDRKPTSLDLVSLSEDWTESQVKEAFRGLPVTCQPYQGSLPVQRACAVDVASTNGVPTLYLSFFFAGGKLEQVAVNVPWWSHGKAYEHLVATLGAPVASQLFPVAGVRLHGWKLPNGAAVFVNRDRPINPLHWNGIVWHSPGSCKQKKCFTK